MAYRGRDYDREQGTDMDWGGRGRGSRGRFGGWNDERQEFYGDQVFGGQERYGEPTGHQYGQGGYGQEFGRQATDWRQAQYGSGQDFGSGGWDQGRMGGRGFRDEDQFGGARGQRGGYSTARYGGESHGRGDFRGSGGWQPNAEQGGGTQGGSWNQDWDWEQGQSGRGNWGQGYSDQDFASAGQSGQRSGGQGYGRQGRPGGTFYYEEVWLIPGPHSGRGPRGYQRNDQRIEEDICERLTHHGQIDAEDIQVQVKNGEVTLTGTVENRRTKRTVEDALDSISGIQDVHNQLRVKQGQGQGQGRSDQDQLIGQTQMDNDQGSSSSGRGQSRNQSRRTETADAGASNS